MLALGGQGLGTPAVPAARGQGLWQDLRTRAMLAGGTASGDTSGTGCRGTGTGDEEGDAVWGGQSLGTRLGDMRNAGCRGTGTEEESIWEDRAWGQGLGTGALLAAVGQGLGMRRVMLAVRGQRVGT